MEFPKFKLEYTIKAKGHGLKKAIAILQAKGFRTMVDMVDKEAEAVYAAEGIIIKTAEVRFNDKNRCTEDIKVYKRV